VHGEFLFLLLSAAVGAICAALSRADRLERTGLALFHVVIACVALASALADGLGARGLDDGRALVAAAAGPFVALLLRVDVRDRRRERLASACSASLLLLGIGTQAALLLDVPAAGPLVVVADGAVVAAAGWLLVESLKRHREANAPLARTMAAADGLAASLLLAAALFALVVSPGLKVDGASVPAPWALALAAAAAWATAPRCGRAPPDRRDVIAAVLVGGLAAAVVPFAFLPGVVGASWTAVAFGRALWPAAPPRTRGLPTPLSPSPVAAETLGSMSPVLADPVLRTIARPRVIARSSARRIVEAAIDRAQRGRPPGEERVAVELLTAEQDADLEADPVDVADALGAIIDSALAERASRPGTRRRVVVVLRASAQSVAFDVADGVDGAAAALGAPPLSTDTGATGVGAGDVDAAVALGRARLLAERHGGSVDVRPGPRGASIQMTIPRRPSRLGVGSA
jgi:hypothetical protein